MSHRMTEPLPNFVVKPTRPRGRSQSRSVLCFLRRRCGCSDQLLASLHSLSYVLLLVLLCLLFVFDLFHDVFLSFDCVFGFLQHSVKVEIEDLAGDGVDFGEELTRAKFEELCMDLFKKYAI